MNLKYLALAAAISLAPTSLSAAEIVTFNGLPGGTPSGTFTEGNVQIGLNGIYVDSGEGELEGLCCTSGGTATLKLSDLGSFAFNSVDFQLEYGSSATLSVTGFLGAVSVFSENFATSNSAYQTFASSNGAATIDRLVFSGQRDFGGGGSFDNVNLSRIAAAVPEPSTWALMLLGFGFVGGAMRSTRITKSKVNFATA